MVYKLGYLNIESFLKIEIVNKELNMINDMEKMAYDYAECYADKSRIKFIEKYLSTFNATAGRMTPLCYSQEKVFIFYPHSISENPASVAIKHRQCG